MLADSSIRVVHGFHSNSSLATAGMALLIAPRHDVASDMMALCKTEANALS